MKRYKNLVVKILGIAKFVHFKILGFSFHARCANQNVQMPPPNLHKKIYQNKMDLGLLVIIARISPKNY